MIVRVTVAHIHAMAAIHHLCFPPEEVWTADVLANLLSTPGITGWISDQGGFVLARRVLETADILTLAVLPEQRRHGCGRLLTQALLFDLGSSDVTAVFLEVAQSNNPARALYEAVGFHAVGLRHAYYRDGSDAVLMSTSLGALSTA